LGIVDATKQPNRSEEENGSCHLTPGSYQLVNVGRRALEMAPLKKLPSKGKHDYPMNSNLTRAFEGHMISVRNGYVYCECFRTTFR
jgi:hypothetical protein